MDAPMELCVAVEKEDAQNVRKKLETAEFFDRSRKIQVLSSGEAVIPLRTCTSVEINDIFRSLNLKYRVFDVAPLPPSRRKQHVPPQDRLRTAISKLLDGQEFERELERDIPTRWEKHGDLILLPDFCFRSPKWKEIQTKVHQQSCENEGLPSLLPCEKYGCFWRLIAESLGGTRLARKGNIRDDPYRSPRVELLLGNDGWVEHTDNGIRYSFDVTRCMFSRGNITEKLRVAGMDCEGETVVDLYAGIGYFTLPFLVHGKAAYVHSCEWNPAAVEALDRNLQLNKVQDRCTVYHGDNREVCPRGVADRVNLGLIPTSRDGWQVACAALRPTAGGILHIHENVTTFPKKDTGGCNVNNCTAETIATANCTASSNNFEETLQRSTDVSYQQTDICSKNKEVSNEFPGKQNLRKGDSENQRYCEKFKLCCHKVHCSKKVEVGTCDIKGFPSSSESVEHVESVTTDEQNTQKDNTGERDTSCLVTSQEENCQRRKTQLTDSAERKETTSVKEKWSHWAEGVADSVQILLSEIQGGTWQTKVLHVEHVKSYAPHVDHLVVDLECRPLQTN